MTIALFGISSLYNSLQSFMNASSLLQASPHNQAARSLGTSTSKPTSHQGSTHSTRHNAPIGINGRPAHASHQRALRVMRIAEQGDAPSCAGRMVISGRMADVCAELDRLVALESQKKSSLPH